MNADATTTKLYFSYGQFMVFDKSVELPGCDWTEEHSAQGFARRESVVNFRTILEFGYANLEVKEAEYQRLAEYERVIAVAFQVTSGAVQVEGPEESNTLRHVNLSPGQLRLVAAQYVDGEEVVIHLYFERLDVAVKHSAVLVADDDLDPKTPLV